MILIVQKAAVLEEGHDRGGFFLSDLAEGIAVIDQHPDKLVLHLFDAFPLFIGSDLPASLDNTERGFDHGQMNVDKKVESDAIPLKVDSFGFLSHGEGIAE